MGSDSDWLGVSRHDDSSKPAPVRVLWLSHFVPYPPKGGALQRSHHLLRRAMASCEVELLALNQRALLNSPIQVEDATRVLEEMGCVATVLPIPADRSRFRWAVTAGLSAVRPDPFDVNWLRSRAFATAVEVALRRGFDVIHCDTIGLIPYLPRWALARTVLNHHNVESHLLIRRGNQESSWWRRAYLLRDGAKLARLEAKVAPLVGVNLVVSELDGQRLQEVAPGSRLRVVENGVDVEYFNVLGKVQPDDRSLVFAGSMGWYPNANGMYYFIEEVWPKLLAADSRFHLTIVGQGPTSRLRAIAEAVPNVKVTGAVEDVRPYIEQAAVYVCPILDGGGTRLKVLDALAMRRPLVATPLAVEGLGLSPGRHFLESRSPQEFVDHILSLRDNPIHREALGAEGRDFVVSHFSWDLIGKRLLDAYDLVRTRSP